MRRAGQNTLEYKESLGTRMAGRHMLPPFLYATNHKPTAKVLEVSKFTKLHMGIFSSQGICIPWDINLQKQKCSFLN